MLGLLFRGFNRWFDRMTDGLRPRGRPHAAAERRSCWSLYGGLLGLTCWQFSARPTGFIPQQDKGYLLLNVQLPDSASVERDGSG